jgi:cytochrome P450
MNDSKSTYDLYSHDFKSCPYDTFAAMRRDNPVQHQPGIDGETPLWFATRYADVEQILTGDEQFARNLRAHRPNIGIPDPVLDQMLTNHMLNKDGEEHRRLRMLVSKGFTPKRVRELRPRVQAVADELIEAVIADGEMDLMADYAFHLPTIVILEMLGIVSKDRDKFKQWANALIMPTTTKEGLQEFMRLMHEFLAYLGSLFAERRQSPGDDLVSALLQVEEAGDRLSENELYSMLMLLIVAGHETTVSLLGNAMVALWRHPEQLALLQALPEFMPRAVEEFLRYDGSVERAMSRHLLQEVELGETAVPPGELVVPILAAANHDPAVFENPEALDVTRTPNPHLGFGKGAHYCLGAPLARLEAEIGLNTLLQRLPNIEPAISLSELRWRLTPGFRSLEALPVKWGV